MLAFIAMALHAGRTSLAAIQRYGAFLTHSQRLWLGFPEKKNGKGRKTPSYKALYNLLGKLDPHAFALVLSEWPSEHEGELTVSKNLCSQTNLNGAVLTADALYDKNTHIQAAVEAGADYLAQCKDQRRGARKTAERLAAGEPPFLPAPSTKATDASKSGK